MLKRYVITSNFFCHHTQIAQIFHSLLSLLHLLSPSLFPISYSHEYAVCAHTFVNWTVSITVFTFCYHCLHHSRRSQSQIFTQHFTQSKSRFFFHHIKFLSDFFFNFIFVKIILCTFHLHFHNSTTKISFDHFSKIRKGIRFYQMTFELPNINTLLS
jgi:hypothetical protein